MTLFLTLILGQAIGHAADAPEIAEPVAAEPVAAEPVAAEPVAAEPVAVEPVAAKPVAAKPVAAKPVAAKPVAAKPVAAKPVAAKPAVVKPVASASIEISAVVATTPSASPAVVVGSWLALPPLLEKVQQEYQKSSGIEAQFDQMTDVKATKQKKKAQGRIWIKRPNKLRWETLNPDPNILVSDGKTFWFYTPPFEKGERGQVIIKKTAQIQTQFLNALLSGTFDFGKGTVVTSKSNTVFELKPKKGTAGDVQTAEVTVNEGSHKIEKVFLTHASGNTTEIKLTDIKLTSQLRDEMFHYVPDHQTDKIVE